MPRGVRKTKEQRLEELAVEIGMKELRAAKNAAKKQAALVVGDLPAGVNLTEGSVIALRDHDGSTVWLRIKSLFDSSAMGPAVTGNQYDTQDAAEGPDDRHYVGSRSLPLSALIDFEAEKAAKREKQTRTTTRRTGGGVCEHCGERTGGGRFLPGHDAKLKSILAADMSAEGFAESKIRGVDNPKWDRDPAAAGGDAAFKAEVARLVKQGDGFLRSRIAQRTGVDTGGAER